MTRSIKTLALALTLTAGVAHAQDGPEATAAKNAVRDAYAALLAQAPLAPPPLFFASTDPKHDNEDYITLKPGEKRRVPLASGELIRLWSTALEPENIELVLDTDLSRIFGPKSVSKISLLKAGRAGIGIFEYKAYVCYPGDPGADAVVLGRRPALLVHNLSNKPNKWFYQATIRPLTSAFDPRNSNPVPPGARQNVLRGEAKLTVTAGGPAQVSALRVKIVAKPEAETLQNGRLLVSLQPKAGGVATPLVDVPIGPLVGTFHSPTAPLQDAMTSWDGQNLTLRWPMPFDGAKQQLAVEVSGTPATIEADVSPITGPNPYRFHVATRGGSLLCSVSPP